MKDVADNLAAWQPKIPSQKATNDDDGERKDFPQHTLPAQLRILRLWHERTFFGPSTTMVKEVMRSALVFGSIGKGAHNRQHRRRQTVRVSIACKLHNTSSNKQRHQQTTRLTVKTKWSLSNKKHHNTR